MRLHPNELMFGVAPRILIDAAKTLQDRRSFSLEDVCMALGAPRSEVLPVLKEMIEAGFIRKLRVGYEGSAKLNQLANAFVGEAMTRSEAEKLLQRVLARAAEINQDPSKLGASVECIVVFGSYLTDAELLTDLDLGVEAREPPRKMDRAEAIRRWEAITSGRISPAGRVFSALRLRQPERVSLHSVEEVLRLGTPYKVVFGTLPEKPKPSGA